MSKKYLKKYLSYVVILISIFVGLVLTFSYSSAETLNAGVLEINYAGSGPLFSATSIAPGYSETKTVRVKNRGAIPHSFSVAVSGALGNLSEVLTVTPKVKGVEVWTKTLDSIAKDPKSSLVVGSIAPGSEVIVDFDVMLSTGAGNAYQGSESFAFSFVVGNESTDQSEPKHNENKFSPPTFITENIAGVVNLASTSTSRLIEDVNTNELSINSEKDISSTSEEGEVNSTIQNPEVKGEESLKTKCFWWWLLLAVFTVFLVIYYATTRTKEMVYGWVWPISVAVALLLVHWGLHSFFVKVRYCDWFWLIELILLLLYFLLAWVFSNGRWESKPINKEK